MGVHPKDERELLRRAVLESIPAEPSQYNEVEPKFVYVPDAHRRALDPDAMLVTGIRGAGKSFWWFALQDAVLRQRLFEPQSRASGTWTVSPGYGATSGEQWPDKDELTQLLSNGCKPRLIWKTVVLRHVAQGSLPSAGWGESVSWVAANPSQVATLLREVDGRMRDAKQRHVVLFDALDRTADRRADRLQLLRGLLELVLELRTGSAVRAKVFVRPDMLEDPEVIAFPDSSKVIASRVKLDWSTADLYSLLFTYLGNGHDVAAAAFFRQQSPVVWPTVGAAYSVPAELRTDPEKQAQLFERLAGPYMGKDRRRGRTYTWVPNHLMDAAGQVSPRSFLATIRRAAALSEVTGQIAPLHWNGIHEGVRKASEYRVGEIQEDLPWVSEAMQKLEDLVVPCDESALLKTWQSAKLTPPQATEEKRAATPADLKETLEQLAKVGVLQKLPSDRINIPDVYRVGFGLRRHGGFRPN